MNTKQMKAKIKRLEKKLHDLPEDMYESSVGDNIYEEITALRERLADKGFEKSIQKIEKAEKRDFWENVT